jgi:hypothetical protein
MPRTPSTNRTGQFPICTDINSDGRASLDVMELGYASYDQQARLFTSFDTTVRIPAFYEPENELFDYYGPGSLSRATVPLRHRQAMTFGIPRMTSVAAAWDRLADHLTDDTIRDYLHEARRTSDTRAMEVYGTIMERRINGNPHPDEGPRPGDIAMFDNDHPGIVNGWLRPSPPAGSAEATMARAESLRAMRGADPVLANLSAAYEIRGTGRDAVVIDEEPVMDRIARSATELSTAINTTVSNAMASMTAAMTAPALPLEDWQERYHARVEQGPEPLARITAPARWGAINMVDPTMDDVRAAGLVEALITGDSVPTADTMDRTAKGLQSWLKTRYGVEVHRAVLRQTAAAMVKLARPAFTRQRNQITRVTAELAEQRRVTRENQDKVRALRAQLVALEEAPRSAPEEAAKAARYDEAMAVALQWSEAPGGAEAKLSAFRRLHHTLTTIADEAATVAEAMTEIDDLAEVIDRANEGIPAEFAIAG